MVYGVKVIHTHVVGEDDRRFYEELILKVNAESFEEAYEKAEIYMHSSVCEYTNINGEKVKTLCVEAVDCFHAFEQEKDVQELYSSFSTNKSTLSESDYYRIIASSCDEKELIQLRSSEYN